MFVAEQVFKLLLVQSVVNAASVVGAVVPVSSETRAAVSSSLVLQSTRWFVQLLTQVTQSLKVDNSSAVEYSSAVDESSAIEWVFDVTSVVAVIESCPKIDTGTSSSSFESVAPGNCALVIAVIDAVTVVGGASTAVAGVSTVVTVDAEATNSSS